MNIGDLDFGYGGDNLYDPGVFKTNLLGEGSTTDYSWFDPDISIGDSYPFTPSDSGVDWGGMLTKGAEAFLSQFGDQSRSDSVGGGVSSQPNIYNFGTIGSGGSGTYKSIRDEQSLGDSKITIKGGPRDSVVLSRGGSLGGIFNAAQLPRYVGQSGTSTAIDSSFGFDDALKTGMRWAGDKLVNSALAAVPGVGTALAAVNTFYPGGITEAAKDVSRFAGDAISGIANVAGDVVGGIGSGIKSVIDWICDERLKVDIAPLETTEVNDELAQMAFFVKGLRECS